MSLLRDIQNDLASPGSDVASVLRKCKILAARLGSDEFATWLDWELNGYPDSQPTPLYRGLITSCCANFLNAAWKAERISVPWQIFPEQIIGGLVRHEFRDGIEKVALFAGHDEHCARLNHPELIPQLQGSLLPEMVCMAVWLEIGTSEFKQLVSAIKNRLLDFVLKIEAENPSTGEASINSQPVAKETVQSLVNIFFGAVGSVAQNSQQFSQTANVGIRTADLNRLVTELSNHLEELNLNPRQKQRADAQIVILRTELAGDPDPAIVKEAGRTLRTITEGAIASLIATAIQPSVWHWIYQALISLTASKPAP